MHLKRVLLVSLCIANNALSANLGNYGQLFSVTEIDIRETIQKKLQDLNKSGELDRKKKEIIQKVSSQVLRPSPSPLHKREKTKVHYVDPSITLNRDVISPNGLLIAKAGTVVNPFDRVSFSQALIFFNADDSLQNAWVSKHYRDYKQVKFILTKGNIKDSSKQFGRVYFDLNSSLSAKLGVHHVPAVVEQSGAKWKVTEIGGLNR